MRRSAGGVCQLEDVGYNPSELVPLSPSFCESPARDFHPLEGFNVKHRQESEERGCDGEWEI